MNIFGKKKYFHRKEIIFAQIKGNQLIQLTGVLFPLASQSREKEI
jgi:hypothetical protein